LDKFRNTLINMCRIQPEQISKHVYNYANIIRYVDKGGKSASYDGRPPVLKYMG